MQYKVYIFLSEFCFLWIKKERVMDELPVLWLMDLPIVFF